MSVFNQRIQPLRDLMKAKGLDAFVLRRNPNLAWAIAGRAHVPTTIDMACFDLIITHDSATAITNVVEAPRLIAEELPSEVTVQTIKWSEGRDPLLPTGSKVGSDQPGADRIDLGVEVEMIRATLIESDLARFKEICVDAAVALGNAMKQVESTDREIDVAGLISHSLWQADLEIAFLGVAGEDECCPGTFRGDSTYLDVDRVDGRCLAVAVGFSLIERRSSVRCVEQLYCVAVRRFQRVSHRCEHSDGNAGICVGGGFPRPRGHHCEDVDAVRRCRGCE